MQTNTHYKDTYYKKNKGNIYGIGSTKNMVKQGLIWQDRLMENGVKWCS